MAKKKKPVDQEFNTVEMKDGAVASSQMPENATVLEKIENQTGGTFEIRDEIKQKLEAFEKMEKAIAQLSSENSALKDKMAEYVEEITALREQAKTPKVVEKEVIKEVFKEVPSSKDSVEIEKLKKEISSLREENDTYLMRISELTFDNAKMTAKMNNMNAQKPPQSDQHAMPQFRNVYRKSGKLNGYSSWN